VVISEGIIPDRVCAQCVRGNTNLCAVYDEIGFTRAGAAADQVLLPAQVVHPLADGVDLAEAALAEPTAVAWRGISRVQPRPGERVAVVGDGTVGLIAAHLLRLFSPAALIVVGQREEQAGLARALGATGFEWAGSAGLDGQFDLVVEAAGTPAAVEAAFRLVRRGGRVLLLGLAGNGVTAGLPIDDVVNNDLVITASFGYTSAAWAEVTGLLSSGRLRLGALITHRFSLGAYAAAYATLRHGTGPRGKVLIEINAQSNLL
jgi:threonine dehydrogenase-like Zn-dependent dehydrogenase